MDDKNAHGVWESLVSSRRLRFFYPVLCLLVFSFAIDRRVLFFEPFLLSSRLVCLVRRVWGRRCSQSWFLVSVSLRLSFFPSQLALLQPQPKRSAFLPREEKWKKAKQNEICLFLNHKAGWTIRSKQRFHLRGVTRAKKRKKGFQIKRAKSQSRGEIWIWKIFTISTHNTTQHGRAEAVQYLQNIIFEGWRGEATRHNNNNNNNTYRTRPRPPRTPSNELFPRNRYQTFLLFGPRCRLLILNEAFTDTFDVFIKWLGRSQMCNKNEKKWGNNNKRALKGTGK